MYDSLFIHMGSIVGVELVVPVSVKDCGVCVWQGSLAWCSWGGAWARTELVS